MWHPFPKQYKIKNTGVDLLCKSKLFTRLFLHSCPLCPYTCISNIKTLSNCHVLSNLSNTQLLTWLMPLLGSLLGNWNAQVQKWKQYQEQRQISDYVSC